jgi:hypothetical protein
MRAAFVRTWEVQMKTSKVVRSLAIVLFAHSIESSAAEPSAPAAEQDADPQALVLELQEEVSQLRGLPFKANVPAGVQSQEEFAQYLDEQIDETLPEIKNNYYGTIVQRLGLYRGTLTNFRDTAKAVMSSQAGAYYDPETKTFNMLMQNVSEMMKRMLYSHELYHGLQDQYFGLQKYLPMKGWTGPELNSDQTMARQAVVEGEATYIMSMYAMKAMTGQEPTRQLMAPAVQMQSQMDLERIRSVMKLPAAKKLTGSGVDEALEASESIPSFILESMIGVYMKGLGFVFAVQEPGWNEVEKLYTEYPPQSTEQILHPEKWYSREAPSAITFPALAKVSALKGWEQLDSDVIGEFQWRVIFKEQGLGAEAEAAAAGWDGDRYVIFKRKDSDATLMLLSTSWDSPAQAEEFAKAYSRLLASKYADAPEPTRVVQNKENVYIVEGGDEKGIAALLKAVTKTRKTKA